MITHKRPPKFHGQRDNLVGRVGLPSKFCANPPEPCPVARVPVLAEQRCPGVQLQVSLPLES